MSDRGVTCECHWFVGVVLYGDRIYVEIRFSDFRCVDGVGRIAVIVL